MIKSVRVFSPNHETYWQHMCTKVVKPAIFNLLMHAIPIDASPVNIWSRNSVPVFKKSFLMTYELR